MEIYGNASTFNLENVLRQNILSSDYYMRTCYPLTSWIEIVDQIYYDVKDIEPWLGGNARGASTAFCLMHRLFTLKISVKEINDMLQHPDSPYIRAVGFLYLRYVCDPKHLWRWFSPYINDKEEFEPSGNFGKTVTIGDFVRDILLDQYYFETIFPRIPKPVTDSIITELKGRGLPTTAKGNAGQGGADRRGVDEGNRRPASVKASLSVAFGQRAPNRSGAKDSDRIRSMASRDSDGGTRGGRDDADGDRRGSKSVDRDGAREKGRERDREWDRDRDRGRGNYRDGDSRRRSPSLSRSTSRSRYERERERERASSYHGRRSRSRSRSRSPRRGRGASDVFRDSVSSRGISAGSEQECRYGDAGGKSCDDGSRHLKDRKGRSASEVFRLGGSR